MSRGRDHAPSGPRAAPASIPTLQAPSSIGVRIAGSGSCVPPGVLTNADLERMMDTSDEWIRQRTGIGERRKCDPSKGESALWMCTTALTRALEDARLTASDLDLIIVGTVTPEMLCPATSCRVGANLGAAGVPAFDVTAACCGFVYSLNVASALIRAGAFRCVGVVGCDHMTSVMDYTDRRTSILFGDAAGSVVLKATDDATRGPLATIMHADGSRWQDLFLPRHDRDFPEGVNAAEHKPGCLVMNGQAVFKFAVKTFSDLIEETLAKVNLSPDDVDHFVCHQSNLRILEASRERFGIPEHKLYVNIERYGNSSAGSVPLCFDELRKTGRVKEGQIVLFVAFGGGLTWASSLWRV